MFLSRISLILVALLVVPTSFARQADDYSALTLSASPTNSTFAAGKPVTVSLTLANTSGKTLKFGFQERDVRGEMLPYPAGLKVRVVDAAGEVLTVNDETKTEWWSWFETWPPVTLSRKASKDKVTLKANATIDRVVDLNQVLGGLEVFGNGLQPGTYTVQFALKGVQSKDTKITVTGDPIRGRRVGSIP